MMRGSLFFLGVLLSVASLSAESPSLHGNSGLVDVQAPEPEQIGVTEVLQVGDYMPEFGIGCSNGNGSSGGPNAFALGVTATSMPANFLLISFSYNLFTNTSPTITHLQFALWSGGNNFPGALSAMTSVPFTGSGFFTHNFSPVMQVTRAMAPGGAFFFGLSQNQTNVGFRAGVDSSSGSEGTSFIRAPTCGAVSFSTLDSVGFPGNWVMRAIATDYLVPVELMTISVDDA